MGHQNTQIWENWILKNHLIDRRQRLRVDNSGDNKVHENDIKKFGKSADKGTYMDQQ